MVFIQNIICGSVVYNQHIHFVVHDFHSNGRHIRTQPLQKTFYRLGGDHYLHEEGGEGVCVDTCPINEIVDN